MMCCLSDKTTKLGHLLTVNFVSISTSTTAAENNKINITKAFKVTVKIPWMKNLKRQQKALFDSYITSYHTP